MRDRISKGLKQKLPDRLVDELLAAYQEAKENFYSGGLRLSAVEGGRFCEAALRLLEFITTGHFTDVNKQLDAERIFQKLKDHSADRFPASVRLHMPRAIRVVYDIRNSRDNAHLADGIDPNFQDATLVVSVLDWIMAEFVRLFHENVSADDAKIIIDSLVERRVPVIQEFDGFKKVLNSKLKASPFIMVLLYECGEAGATFTDLYSWVRPQMRQNLQRTLNQLVDKNAYVHFSGKRYILTRSGAAEVEKKKLHGESF
ncbi:MAG: hypothetical protein KIT76_14725 [Pseudolabrys sp.]|nr:hypothetical protein [Pseudolabrys sp.]